MAWLVEPSAALQKVKNFPVSVIIILLVVLFANLLVVSFRFWRTLSHLHITMPWATALRASMAGNIAGLFFIPLIGQVAGRHAFLEKSGVSSIVNASIAAFERVLLALISGSLVIWGVLHLVGWNVFSNFFASFSVWQIMLAALLGLVASHFFGGGHFERRFARSIFGKKIIIGVVEVGAITLFGQILMLSCYIYCFYAIAPSAKLGDLLAAAVIVSFAASLPLSVGGWGAREFSAVYVLGWLGIPAEDAIIASVVIGVCSTLVLIGAIPFVRRPQKVQPSGGSTLLAVQPYSDVDRYAVWLLSMATCVAVFFQAHVDFGGNAVNINIADPFAMFAFIAFVLQLVSCRRLPEWRANWVNASLAAISVVLVFGFFNGRLEIGVTAWALGGRLLGWIVLLGYCAAGALLVVYFGRHGLRRLVETSTFVICSVILVQVAVRLLATLGVLPLESVVGINFEGYAGNRNAFAFQTLAVSALLVTYSSLYARAGNHRKWLIIIAAQSLIMAGLILSGSRTGMIVAAIMIVISFAARFGRRDFILWAVCGSLVVWIVALYLPEFAVYCKKYFQVSGPKRPPSVQTSFSVIEQASDFIRWKMMAAALQMWLQNPIVGAGLGVFLQQSVQTFGFSLVIHSTPLWILAEFGLLGFMTFGWLFYNLSRYAIRFRKFFPQGTALFLLLVVFFVFCQTHEILYQRIFWLFIGALIARTLPRKSW